MCPLYFALAHVHHLIEKVRNGTTLVPALLGTLVQMSYTSIFGIIAALLFMRTGSIFPPIISHIICNYASLPDTGFMYPPPTLKSTLSHNNSNNSNANQSEYSCLYAYRQSLIVIHIGGLVFFVVFIMPITQHAALSSMYWGGILAVNS